jgi:glycosyltransferase involved in cell wall biosynthesis
VSLAAHARRIAGPVGRPLRRALVGVRTRDWPPHSRLFVEQEAAVWVLAYEARQLERTARALGVELGPPAWARGVADQSIFHLSQFTLLLHDFERRGEHLGFAWFHGRPNTPGMPEFDACFDAMRRRHEEIDRVRVTNRAMEELVLETGIDAGTVHRIPIGIDVDAFRFRSESDYTASRRALGLPESAFVVGSFQKDGVGWEDGLEPKLIKGPDVLLATVERLRERIPELYVVVTGPSRGYVKAGLERLGVPYRHLLLPDVDAVADVYRRSTLSRHLPRRGRPARRPRGDGDRGPARHDTGRAGIRPRAARRERLDGRGRGRRRPRAVCRARRGREAERARPRAGGGARHG